jgi:hypothetical protein
MAKMIVVKPREWGPTLIHLPRETQSMDDPAGTHEVPGDSFRDRTVLFYDVRDPDLHWMVNGVLRVNESRFLDAPPGCLQMIGWNGRWNNETSLWDIRARFRELSGTSFLVAYTTSTFGAIDFDAYFRRALGEVEVIPEDDDSVPYRRLSALG